MTQAVTARPGIRTRRGILSSVILLLLAAVTFLLTRGSQGLTSTFVLTSQRGGVTIAAPELPLPTALTLWVMGSVILMAAIALLVREFKSVNTILTSMIALAILAFLVWATRDKSLNLTGMLVSSVVRATPIALAALSGIYSERSGVVNIGIEGMMLMGAFVAVIFASLTGSPFLGILAGMAAGMSLGLLHGLLSIKYRVNQIISGTGIIILALGLTSYLHRAFLEKNPALNSPGPAIPALAIPVLWKIPVIGPILFNQSPVIYALFALLILTQVLMYRTRWGLRVRAVGEHPRAADTLGINVFRTRYISVLLSGAFAGLGGAYMSIGSAGRFNEGMSAGKGFLGLAAMIFGNWNPGGAYLGALIFGFFDSWQEKLSILQVGVPPELLGMAARIDAEIDELFFQALGFGFRLPPGGFLRSPFLFCRSLLHFFFLLLVQLRFSVQCRQLLKDIGDGAVVTLEQVLGIGEGLRGGWGKLGDFSDGFLEECLNLPSQQEVVIDNRSQDRGMKKLRAKLAFQIPAPLDNAGLRNLGEFSEVLEFVEQSGNLQEHFLAWHAERQKIESLQDIFNLGSEPAAGASLPLLPNLEQIGHHPVHFLPVAPEMGFLANQEPNEGLDRRFAGFPAFQGPPQHRRLHGQVQQFDPPQVLFGNRFLSVGSAGGLRSRQRLLDEFRNRRNSSQKLFHDFGKNRMQFEKFFRCNHGFTPWGIHPTYRTIRTTTMSD